MKLTRLHLVGFKSFVEPTEVPIEPGLTGVVGPNGCGKSNLVEALRWVMGESSHKNMRASGMEDVIFAGSSGRPSRNMAEVSLFIDNSARTAPAAFNDTDSLEVARRIEREAGSTYRINGREVRQRDVQILFADAATGARSPALVRQGQINEIIAAKPQARRRILEDAAGIAGLHARRHEAELRLKAAEDNLVRVEDVLKEIEAQVENLKRQGRQATRYRGLSAEIRRLEALLLAIGHAEAVAQVEGARREADADLKRVADSARAQAESATAQAVAAHALPPLRDAEAAAAAGLQRLTLARAELDAEQKRATARLAELDRQIAELQKDAAREEAQQADAAASLLRLGAEETELAKAAGGFEALRAERAAAVEAVERTLAEGEAALNRLLTEHSDRQARRAALQRTLKEEAERATRFAAERARLERELTELDQRAAAPVDELAGEVRAASEALKRAEAEAVALRRALDQARDDEAAARGPLAEAERAAQRLETEARTLAKLVTPASGDLWPKIVDAMTVERGFEKALGAALGDDLEASTNPSAPAHWQSTEPHGDDPALPEGVPCLADRVTAPPALARRLRQIGLVDRADGPRLRAALKPGQRLVSREGDLWRWDGFTSASEAPNAAARRLAERNRLGEVETAAAAARAAVEPARAAAEAALLAVKEATRREAASVEGVKLARRALDQARERLTLAERRAAETASRRAALSEAAARTHANEAEARQRLEAAEAALASVEPRPEAEAELARRRAEVAERRAAAAEARGALQSLVREAELRAKRREAIAADIRSWGARTERAASAAADLKARLGRASAERDALAARPETTALQRRRLAAEIEGAEAQRRQAADRLAEAETRLTEADRAARAGLEALSAAREARAGSQARLEAAGQRVEALVRAIGESLGVSPAELPTLAGLKPGAPLPDAGETERRLNELKADRERLGGVNLRAEDELKEIEDKRDGLVSERDDLVEAIRRLRGAIGSLNREGRERLIGAFDTVNGHFRRLFTRLFGGGEADLTLVDSDDPLEAGLEILARPPGKKPQTMTLLSGGEQALTAVALIFAVFLTNPSPICVLDEVDAPLDDANVERTCDLLDEMARETDTRFLVITHNPITMARMSRLFGVTMAERGVSQLVSVDLIDAERMLEAV